MNNKRLRAWERGMLLLSAAALVGVLIVPMWQIQLSAPQYPEGLVLLIFPHRLGGNVDIINGLNHYIGMKTLHTADFIEFTLLPYIIGFFALLLLANGILGNRKLLIGVFLLFLCFGIVAMADFWKWEYNYGHHLNPDAAIVVPGMAYQPPLIGFKQLLNFGAYSIPDWGGWLFILVGVIQFILVGLPWFSRKGRLPGAGSVFSLFLGIACFQLTACSRKAQPLILGKDQCDYCKMTVMDNRFGAELITPKGRLYKFDDAHCIFSFMKEGHFDLTQNQDIYFVDFAHTHSLLRATQALFLKSDAFKSPMEGNLAAFADAGSLQLAQQTYLGKTLSWPEIIKP